MVFRAPGTLELWLMSAEVHDAGTTFRGASLPLPRLIAEAEMGTSPSAEMKIMLGASWATVGFSRSNLITVTDVAGTVCPDATASVKLPVWATHLAVVLNSAPESRSVKVESGVMEPSNPEIVMVEFLAPVKENCGLKETVVVFVAPGDDVL